MTVPPAPGVVHPDDVAELLHPLHPGVPYAFSDLYDGYAEIARANGREPAARRSLGVELTRLGLTAGRTRGARTWAIPLY